ncbi:MAG: hypothetical protein KDE27_21275 [Planctomycetes bacterium]|nr:hypothetical protein [Planctomycetota bacterium]
MRTLVACLALLAPISAQTVVKDHVSNPVNWNGIGLANCTFAGAGSASNGVLASQFAGTGGSIENVSGIFACNLGPIPNPNAWWTLFTYRILFYPSSSAFQADPYGMNPATSGVQEFTLAAPSNASHPTPVGSWQSGPNSYPLHRLEFDLAGAGFSTIAGAPHLLAILPTSIGGGAFSGLTNISFSNSTSATGAAVDWYKNWTMGPASLASLNAPYDHGAYRIVLGNPTGPNAPTFTTTGTGCPTPNAPWLALSESPRIGTTPTITANDLPGDTIIAALFVGSTPITLPLDTLLGAPGCTGYVDNIFTSPTMSLSAPSASLDIAIPNNPALVGGVLHMQTLGIALNTGWTASDRGTLTIGS